MKYDLLLYVYSRMKLLPFKNNSNLKYCCLLIEMTFKKQKLIKHKLHFLLTIFRLYLLICHQKEIIFNISNIEFDNRQ